MSKRKGKKKRNRRKPNLSPVPEVEVYQHGPLQMEQLGRMVTLSANWGEGEYEKYVSDVVADRPQLKERINARIAEVLSIIRDHDPYELLAVMSIRNTLVDPQNYTESIQQNQLPHAEYAQSLVLSQANESSRERPSLEVLERFSELISTIFHEVIWYFGSEALEVERSDQEKEIRFLSLVRSLVMRGDSYPNHHHNLIRGLFDPHDALLEEHYGFTTEKIIAGMEAITDQIQDNLNGFRSGMYEGAIELQNMFEEHLRGRADESVDIERERTEWQQRPEIEAKAIELQAAQSNLWQKIFALEPSVEAPESLLATLSARFGENGGFASFEKAPGWPTNDSIVSVRPLIHHNGSYYCFVPQLLTVNAVAILESLIKEKDKAYFEASYYKGRAAYLEQSALKYLSDLLPGAKVFRNLYYRAEVDGAQGRAETDGIVLHDNNLFILEAKAGSLSTSTRRGGLDRTKRDLKRLVEEAYSQALRTKRFILEQDRPVFEYGDGSEALVIEGKEKLDNIFLVNVTLESLQHLSTQLSSLKAFDFIKGQEWPWSVFINDLRVVSELIESPSEFLLFLKRRIRANDYPQFRTVDELDFLMFFLSEGLYFEDNFLKDVDVLQPTGFTDDLDLYYEHLRGNMPTVEKPKFEIPDEYKDLVREIEAIRKEGFTRVTTALLDCDSEAFEAILSSLRMLKRQLATDRRDHDLSLHFNEPISRGITFVMAPAYTPEVWNKANRYCKLKKYQTRFREWILIIMEVRRNGRENYDFRVYRGEWQYDPDLERAVEARKKAAIKRHLREYGKIGRNAPCPCNSGLKYKKCCGA